MTLAAVAFAAGAAALQWQAVLPAWGWGWGLPACLLITWVKPKLAVPFALIAGFLWATAFAHLRMGDWLAPELEGRDLEGVGVVASLPARLERGPRFAPDGGAG